jgi:hypothetical protein
MQCLNQVLRSERPDIDKKRNDLLKLQGEFAARLRHLEKALLNALSESKGRILDDDSVITTLERLKTEAKEVAEKSAETDKVMKEVHITYRHNIHIIEFLCNNYFIYFSLILIPGRSRFSKICTISPCLVPYLHDHGSSERSTLPLQLFARVLAGYLYKRIEFHPTFESEGQGL